MNNFRRRVSGEGIEYIFTTSYQSLTINNSYNSTSTTVTSTADGVYCNFSVLSKPSFVTRTLTSGKYLYIYVSSNNTIYDNTGTLVLLQQDSGKTISITITHQGKDYISYYGGIVLDSTSNSIGSVALDVTLTNYSISNVPSWVRVTYSSNTIFATALSTNSGTYARGARINITVENKTFYLNIYQMPGSYNSIDGYQYVTINGLKWAIKNVGASSITNPGKYYKYGAGAIETTGQLQDGSYYSGTENPLSYSLDTARQVMGGGWRMPTNNELGKLGNSSDPGSHNNLTCFVTYNGVSGIVAGNTREDNADWTSAFIFIPLSGYYDTSGPNLLAEYWTCFLTSTPGSYGIRTCCISKCTGYDTLRRLSITGNGDRDYAYPVRAVHD